MLVVVVLRVATAVPHVPRGEEPRLKTDREALPHREDLAARVVDDGVLGEGSGGSVLLCMAEHAIIGLEAPQVREDLRGACVDLADRVRGVRGRRGGGRRRR